MISANTLHQLRKAMHQYNMWHGRSRVSDEQLTRTENRLIQACRNLVQEDDDAENP